MVERISHFLDGGEDIFFEIFIASQFGARHIYDLERFASESYRSVLIEEDGDVCARLNLLAYSVNHIAEKSLFVAVIVALAQ